MDKRIDAEQKPKKKKKEQKSQYRFKISSSPISFLHMMTSREPEIKGIVTDGPNQSCEEHDSQTNPQGTH